MESIKPPFVGRINTTSSASFSLPFTMSYEGNKTFFPNQWIVYHPTPQWVFPCHPQWAMKEIDDFSPMDHIPSYSSESFSLSSSVSHEGNRRFSPNGSCTILLLSEFFLIISNEPWRKHKIFPQWIMYHPTLWQVFLTIPSEPWRKQKIFPQWIIYHPTHQQVFPYYPLTRAHILQELNMQVL